MRITVNLFQSIPSECGKVRISDERIARLILVLVVALRRVAVEGYQAPRRIGPRAVQGGHDLLSSV